MAPSRSVNGRSKSSRRRCAWGAPIHLHSLALERAWLGDFAGAGLLVAESDSVAAATGSQVPPFAVLRLRALQGREADASPLIEAVIQQGTARRAGHRCDGWVLGGICLVQRPRPIRRGGVGSARSHSERHRSLGIDVGVAELVEAAARVGDTEFAHDAVDRLAETTQPAGTEFALGSEARSRALLSDGAAAEELYREAIDRLSRTRLRPELARAHLLYGEWLRREGRRVDAREQLRTAHDMLATIGMEAFAKRARRELLATGEKVRKRSPDTRDQLTPQEEQIARLARDGLSNPEIGTQLFLSARTVEWHLSKVFGKLEIRSRRELRAVLPDQSGLLASA